MPWLLTVFSGVSSGEIEGHAHVRAQMADSAGSTLRMPPREPLALRPEVSQARGRVWCGRFWWFFSRFLNVFICFWLFFLLFPIVSEVFRWFSTGVHLSLLLVLVPVASGLGAERAAGRAEALGGARCLRRSPKRLLRG